MLEALANDPAIGALVQTGFIVTMIVLCAGGVACEAARRWRG
jgi:hypothetical protein